MFIGSSPAFNTLIFVIKKKKNKSKNPFSLTVTNSQHTNSAAHYFIVTLWLNDMKERERTYRS